MPIPPYAILTVSVNGGAAQTGGVTVTAGDTLDFRLENTTGVITQKFEIYDYPTGFPQPAGWSVDANGVYYYTTDTTPPTVTTSTWGKLMGRVRINAMVAIGTDTDEADPNLYDEATAISVPSGAGFVDVGANETSQFSYTWIKEWQKDLRLMAAGGLSAPANPADDDKLAFAVAGALDYAAGVKVLNPGGAQDGLELTEIDSPAATDLTLKGTGGEVKIDTGGAAIRAQFSNTVSRGLEIYKAGGTSEYSATDYDKLSFVTDGNVAIGYTTANTAGAGSDLAINGQDALAASGAAGGDITITTGAGDGAALDGFFTVEDGSAAEVLRAGTDGTGKAVSLFGTIAAAGTALFRVDGLKFYQDGGYIIQIMPHSSGAGNDLEIIGQAGGAGGANGGDVLITGGMDGGGAVDGGVILRNGATNTIYAVGQSGGAPAHAWFGVALANQPTIVGAKGGNAALANLLTALATAGLLVDNTT